MGALPEPHFDEKRPFRWFLEARVLMLDAFLSDRNTPVAICACTPQSDSFRVPPLDDVRVKEVKQLLVPARHHVSEARPGWPQHEHKLLALRAPTGRC